MITIPSRSTVTLAGSLLAVITAFAASPALAADGVATLGSPPPEEEQDAVATSVEDPMDAILDYAACMREHGVDMPDPQGMGDGFVMSFEVNDEGDLGDPGSFMDSGYLAAEEACREHLGAMAAASDPVLEAEIMEGLLAYADCMREHGIDMPDPVMSNGGFMIGAPGDEPALGDLDLFSEVSAAAQEACRDSMPFSELGTPSDATP
jgi:hypothetical protein